MSKSLCLKILIAVSIAMSAFVLIMFYVYADVTDQFGMKMTGIPGFYQSLSQTQVNIIFISIWSAIFICHEFANRTFGLSLFSGFKRSKLMAAKIITLCIGVVIVTTVMPVIMTIGYTVMNDFGGTAEEFALPMLRDYGLYLLGNLTLAAFCSLVAYTIRNVGGTIGACIGIGFAVNIVSMFPFEEIKNIAKFTFLYQLSIVGNDGYDIPFYICVMVATLAVVLVCSSVVIEKSDLK
jgi:ABC-type transport system involved in multi-copper enzyme maturation permease subunit